MNFKIILYLVICVSLVKPLKLSRRRPSTAWGVQKKTFRQKLEKDHFSSRDGTYQFEYDTGNGKHQIFRSEKRFSDGTIVGFYGYVDPEGILRITEYVAGRYGYKQRTVLRYLHRIMEDEILKKLKTLIEAITHSGSNTLDEDIMKEVKKICKSSQSNIPLAYDIVMGQLKKKNSQIRLAAFQICRELFKRSGIFRENVLKDLKQIFELVSEISSKKLPPPISSAERLKALSISTLKEWVKEYGESYKKLKVAYNYFKTCKQVDFETLEVGNSSEQVVQNEQQRHLRIVNEEKIKRILDEFNSNESEIEMTITTLSNCLSLLLPPVDEFFIPEVNLNEPSTSKAFSTDSYEHYKSVSINNVNSDENNERDLLNSTNNLREFGIPLDYSLTLKLNMEEKFKVVKTEENISVIENAKDCVRLICNRYLPMVKNWIKIYCKCSNGSSNEVKKIIDLKEKLEKILKKHNTIVINDSCPTLDENSSDDEFEEVTKEGYEESVNFSEIQLLDCLKEKSNINSNVMSLNSKKSSEEEKGIAVNNNEQSSSGASSSTSEVLDRKTKLLSIAPKLPYDIDLYHWEDEHLSTPTLISTKIDVDKFWGSAGSEDIHEIPNPDGVAALRTRVIEFSGVFEPVKWACRAPLPNGKLCPRKDRVKCPFHGKIIARDEMGNIQNAEDQKNADKAADKCVTSIPDFQDPEYLRDLQAATGVDLKIPERKGKKRKSDNMNLTHKKMKTSAAALKIVESKKLPGLVDVVKKQNNAYTRLSKKIFNRSSLRRVSSVLNKLDRKKFVDKFGDQFNYL